MGGFFGGQERVVYLHGTEFHFSDCGLGSFFHWGIKKKNSEIFFSILPATKAVYLEMI
jgi:hypothetical protein